MDLEELQRQWCDGKLYPWLREQFGPLTEPELDRHFCSWNDSGSLPTFERMIESESDIRRWCWSPNWTIMAQDEDLLLMADNLIPTLLDEVYHRCPKADYVMAIVLHHMRDSAHAALKTDLGTRLREMQVWLPHLERLQTHDVTYAHRLLGYARLCKVNRSGAIQRVLDLRRCDPDESNPPQLKELPNGWSSLITSRHVPAASIFIERATGKMRLL